MAESRHVRISIISLWVGILIPILAALIPAAITYFSPEQKLEFSLVGPISAKDTQAVSITVTNHGGNVAKDVTVLLRHHAIYELPEAIRTKGRKTKDPLELLAVESKTNVIVSKGRDHYVLTIGDLRPNEQATVDVIAQGVRLALHRFSDSASGIEVKSAEQIASFKGDSIWDEFLYPAGFWMFVILMIFMLVFAFYQEYFMDRQTREKLILKEIDKLKD
jgi:hypothetical protein